MKIDKKDIILQIKMKQLLLFTVALFILTGLNAQTIIWEIFDNGNSNYLNPEGTAIIPNDSGTYWTLENAEHDNGSYFGISRDLQGKIYDINGNEVLNNNLLYSTGIYGINNLNDYSVFQNDKLLISGFQWIPYKDISNEQIGVVCIDNMGNLLWEFSHPFNLGWGDNSSVITKDVNGNIYFYFEDDISNDTIFKISNDGNVIWGRSISYATNTQEFLYDDLKNQFLLFSYTSTGVNIIYLDTMCQPIDTIIYNGNANDSISKALMFNDGSFIFIGCSNSTNNYFVDNHGGYDGWITKCDSSGNVIWSKCYGGSQDDKLYFISSTNDGGFLVAGKTKSNNYDVSVLDSLSSGTDRGWLMKIDSLGNILWQYFTSDRIFSANQTLDNCYVLSAGTKPNAYFSKIAFFGYNIIQLDSLDCHNTDSTNIFGTAYGGIPPYTYQWSTGDTTANLINVPLGIYYVIVTDSLGNSNTDTISTYSNFSTPQICINTDTSNNYRKILIANYSTATDSMRLIAQNSFDTINVGTFSPNSVVIDSIYIDSLYDYHIVAFNSCGQNANSEQKTPLFIKIDSTNSHYVYLTCTAKLGFPQFPPSITLYRRNPDGTLNHFNNALSCLNYGINNTCSIVDSTLSVSGEYKYFFVVNGNPSCFFSSYFSNVVTVDVVTDNKSEESNNSISIFPIPTNERLSIQSNNRNNIEKIEIINISEKILKTYFPQKTRCQISLRDLSNGLYFIRLQTKDGFLVKKIIKI